MEVKSVHAQENLLIEMTMHHTTAWVVFRSVSWWHSQCR